MGNPSVNIIALPRVAKADQPRLATNEELAESIGRAQGNLLRQQKPDGHWVGELMVDSTLCSDYVLFMGVWQVGVANLQAIAKMQRKYVVLAPKGCGVEASLE